MSDVESPATKREIRWRIWQQLPLLLVLVVLWMLMWGSLTPLTIITGIVVAILVTRAFYLPPVELSGRFNVLWFVVFLVRFGVALVVGSFQVAFLAFTPKAKEQNSIVAVQLVTRSDFVMTLTAIAISLIPGSIVVEVDRAEGILYLHALGANDDGSIDRVRHEVQVTEQRLVRAIGSKDDMTRMNAGRIVS